MTSLLIPDYWRHFVDTNHLLGREIEFPWPGEENLVAVIEILDDKISRWRLTNSGQESG